jgi:hypothetical protein
VTTGIVTDADLLLGVVGLAIAQRLSERFPTKSTYLVERHPHAGEETRRAVQVLSYSAPR